MFLLFFSKNKDEMEAGTTVLDKMRRVFSLISLRSCDNSILEQNLWIWQGNTGGSGKCFSLLPCEKSSEIWTGCERWKVSVHIGLAQTQHLENKPLVIILNMLLGLVFPRNQKWLWYWKWALRKIKLSPEQQDLSSSGLASILGKQSQWHNEGIVV